MERGELGIDYGTPDVPVVLRLDDLHWTSYPGELIPIEQQDGPPGADLLDRLDTPLPPTSELDDAVFTGGETLVLPGLDGVGGFGLTAVSPGNLPPGDETIAGGDYTYGSGALPLVLGGVAITTLDVVLTGGVVVTFVVVRAQQLGLSDAMARSLLGLIERVRARVRPTTNSAKRSSDCAASMRLATALFLTSQIASVAGVPLYEATVSVCADESGVYVAPRAIVYPAGALNLDVINTGRMPVNVETAYYPGPPQPLGPGAFRRFGVRGAGSVVVNAPNGGAVVLFSSR